MFVRSFRRLFITSSPLSFHKKRIACPSQLLRMASTLPPLPVFEAIAGHDPKSTAVIHSASGRRFTYGELFHDLADASHKLREQANTIELAGQRVAFLVENGYDYVGARAADRGYRINS